MAGLTDVVVLEVVMGLGYLGSDIDCGDVMAGYQCQEVVNELYYLKR